MTVVNTETGELIEFDKAAAERRAERITLRLDSIAENYRMVLPMIREAIEKRDDMALGYRSPGDYVSDRFGQSLAGLGMDVRRAVVGELTEAGLSTRAIAPVVGASLGTVNNDQQVFRAEHLTDPDVIDAELVDHETPQGEAASDDAAATPDDESDSEPQPERPVHPRPAVTGIDGKTYKRPEPKAAPRKPLADTARNAGWDLRKAVERIERIAADDRFHANAEQVATELRSHLQNAVEVCQDLLARIDNKKESTQ
jgi:hypothetical protein